MIQRIKVVACCKDNTGSTGDHRGLWGVPVMSRCSQGTGRVTRATAAPDPVFWHLKNRFRIKKILRFLCRFPPQPEGLAARTRLGKSCDSCRAGGKSPGTAMRGLCLRFPWAGAAPANRRLSQRAEGGRDAAPACRAARLLPGALKSSAALGSRRVPLAQRCCQGQTTPCSALVLLQRPRLEQTQSKA